MAWASHWTPSSRSPTAKASSYWGKGLFWNSRALGNFEQSWSWGWQTEPNDLTLLLNSNSAGYYIWQMHLHVHKSARVCSLNIQSFQTLIYCFVLWIDHSGFAKKIMSTASNFNMFVRLHMRDCLSDSEMTELGSLMCICLQFHNALLVWQTLWLESNVCSERPCGCLDNSADPKCIKLQHASEARPYALVQVVLLFWRELLEQLWIV